MSSDNSDRRAEYPVAPVVHGFRIPDYQTWKAMPNGLRRAAIAAAAYFWPGDYGPWDIPRRDQTDHEDDQILHMLCEALAAEEARSR